MNQNVPSRRTPGFRIKTGPRLSPGRHCFHDACAGTTNKERGSILFYILLAVVLFAALSSVVAAMLRGGGDYGAGEQARLHAHGLIEYAQKAKITVQDMKLSGIDAADLSFLKPDDGGYTTAPHTRKVFHPSGGGLPLQNLSGAVVDKVFTPVVGPYITRMSIEEVGTNADEVVFSVRGVQQGVCARINLDLTGSAVIPSTGVATHEGLFVTGADDLDGIACADCVGVPSMCVSQTGPEMYTFYAVVDTN